MRILTAILILAGASFSANGLDSSNPPAIDGVVPSGVTLNMLADFRNLSSAAREEMRVFSDFGLDNHGRPYILSGKKLVFLDDGCGNAEVLNLDSPSNCAAFTSDGALLTVSGKSLGVYTKKGIKPVIPLPGDAMKIRVSRGAGVFLYDKTGRVYEYAPGTGLACVASVKNAVSDVSTDGKKLFISTGSSIIMIAQAGKYSLLCDAGSEIISLSQVGNYLFFSTSGGVYVCDIATGKYAMFAKCRNSLVRGVGDVLYIFSKDAFLCRLENVSGFRKMFELNSKIN